MTAKMIPGLARAMAVNLSIKKSEDFIANRKFTSCYNI